MPPSSHPSARTALAQHQRRKKDAYLRDPLRRPFHAGGAYPQEPGKLRALLAGFFSGEGGPGRIARRARAGRRTLCGVLSPHIDFRRGGPAYAWAYKTLAERSDADLFVIFGTAHAPMRQLFCITRKDFDTPLGAVATDQAFVDWMAADLASSVAGRRLDLFADELTHRDEHSIEFQAVFLRHVLGGRRKFRIAPILVGSLHDFLWTGKSPARAAEVQVFLAALRTAVDQHPGKVCYISGADFAHVGPRFGDRWLVNEKRLAAQSKDDHALLERACRCDAAGFFRHIARRNDRSRICGLAPTYIMLEALGEARGELLTYGQAVAPDGTACVSFASAAFYRE